MANIVSEKTVGNILILQVDADPSQLPDGAEAPMGSLATILGVGDLWQKVGANPTDWAIILAGTGTPVTIGSTNQEGVADLAARSDHVHAHGDQAGGSLHDLATTIASGFMSDIDKTKLDSIKVLKVYANTVVATAFSSGTPGAPKRAAVLFTTPLPSTDYTITITSADVRVWTFESKATTGFTINSNGNQVLSGEVHWQVIEDYQG
jgi:hypothetical protein